MSFLPIKASEVGLLPLDIVLISGEAYCDHPSFGHAIVSRLVEHMGLSIGIISQPQSDSDYMEFGAPKHGFFISGGVVDSMVNNFTVAKIRRTEDSYSEGGVAGRRPDRCVDVYTRALKRLYPDSAVVIGGIEASLRRFVHYDYWADKVLPSILESSGADLLIYGMGERPIMEICRMLSRNIPLANIRDVRGTCYIDSYENLPAKLKSAAECGEAVYSAPFSSISVDKKAYIKAYLTESSNQDYINAKVVLQKQNNGRYVVQNLPQIPLSESELDLAYALPYERNYHPSYTGGVPAIEEVKYSITSHRGCFGSCNYCALTYHQGRVIQKRSKQSVIDEAKLISQDKDFKGYIHDVGGPTANFRNKACKHQEKNGVCKNKSCIGYEPCNNLEVSHSEYLSMLRSLREIEGVKKVFVRSGIRYDYLMKDSSDEFLHELIAHHISGQLKVAPEHVSDKVLKVMNKPSFDVYLKFKDKYDKINIKRGKKQFLVPYLISSHPGATLGDAVEVAEYLHSIHYMPEQVQDFYPTPATKSTAMYYTGINPDNGEEVYVARTKEEKRMQRALLQYRRKENYLIVKEALLLAGRSDLIGFGEKCLIKPTQEEILMQQKMAGGAKTSTAKPGYWAERNKKIKASTSSGHSGARGEYMDIDNSSDNGVNDSRVVGNNGSGVDNNANDNGAGGRDSNSYKGNSGGYKGGSGGKGSTGGAAGKSGGYTGKGGSAGNAYGGKGGNAGYKGTNNKSGYKGNVGGCNKNFSSRSTGNR